MSVSEVSKAFSQVYFSSVKTPIEEKIQKTTMEEYNAANAANKTSLSSVKSNYSGASSVSVGKTESKAILASDTKVFNSDKGASPLRYEILDISELSMRISREIAKLGIKKGPDDPSNGLEKKWLDAAPEISDQYILDLMTLGASVEKVDENMSDIQWGSLLQLGHEVGLSDPAAIAALTPTDIEIYFDAKFRQSDEIFEKFGSVDENGVEIKRYENPDDIWKDIFKTKDNGEFLTGFDGKAVRNKEFSWAHLSFFNIGGSRGNIPLSKSGPQASFAFAMAVRSGNIMRLDGDEQFQGVLKVSQGFGELSNHYYYNEKSGSLEENILKYRIDLARVFSNIKGREFDDRNHSDGFKNALEEGKISWTTYKPFA